MPRARRRVCLAALAVLSVLGVAGPVAAQASSPPGGVEVMTRNLYLGADLTPAVAATNEAQLRAAGSSIWRTVARTNFVVRSRLLAKEIAAQRPDLIGLQEAATWRIGPDDGIPAVGGGAAPTVVLDYLKILQAQLKLAGAPYVVVVDQPEADIEGPTNDGFDIRLTQHDVILARKDKVDNGGISWTNAAGAHYPASIQLKLPLLGGLVQVESTRGYVSAEMTVDGSSFRFVDTHLEAFSAGRRAQQAGFLAQFGPASATDRPVVLVGDLNSDPADGASPGAPADPTPNNVAYNVLRGVFGYQDAWLQAGSGPGYTSGFNELVNDADTSGLDHRIDHVLTRGNAAPASSAVVTGTDPANRLFGLWPSDHAGLVAVVHP